MNKKTTKVLTQPMYYILLSLKEKRHGYEIMQYIDWLTDSRVKVGPGTLYSLLSRFEDDKLIKLVSDDDNKKTYIITDEGKERLNQEVKRLGQLLEDAKLVEGGQEDEFQDRKGRQWAFPAALRGNCYRFFSAYHWYKQRKRMHEQMHIILIFGGYYYEGYFFTGRKGLGQKGRG